MKKTKNTATQVVLPVACTVAIGIPGAAVIPAAAQETAPAEPERMEKIIVTGSNIESADAAGTLTVSVVDIAEPANVGRPALADTLRVRAPQYAGGTGAINPGFGNGGDGSSQLSLRGLPANATLLLVNGRRTSTSDLNLIPEAAIEKIEILQDGASAIYGSDAVAGVANIILKEEYTGAKIGAYYANTTDTDISDWKTSVLVGETTEKSKFVMAAEYGRSNDQLSVDRERSKPLSFQVSGTSNPGLFLNNSSLPSDEIALRWSLVPTNTRGLTNITQIPAGFNPIATVKVPEGANRTSVRNAAEAELNAALPADSPVRYGGNPSLMPGMDPGFPYPYYTTAYRPHERYSVYMSGSHQLYGENLEAFMLGYYASNSSSFQLAPSPLAGVEMPASNYWYQLLFPEAAATGTPLRVSYRPVELGPRITYNDFENTHLVAGLRGRIAESSWKWETAFTWDRTEIDETQTGGVLSDVYVDLLSRSTPDAWNPFGYTPIGGSSVVNPRSLVDQIYGEATIKTVAELLAWDAKINGEIYKLPGGALAGAVGTEYRRETLDFAPDYAIRNGSVFPFNVQQPLYAARDSMAVFGEVLVPIFGEDLTLPAFKSLSVSAAIRYEDYSDVGDTGVKPRVSFKWQPIDHQFTIRGSYAEGFIAPGFFDLYQLPGEDYIEVLNPYTRLREQPENAVLTIGNPELKPIDAENWTIGGVFEPDFIKGFKIALDYYRIRQTGIPFASAQYIVNQWYNYNPNDPRDPTNPFGPNAAPSAVNPLGAQVELLPTDEISQIRNVGPINTGERLTDGIDITVSQRIDTSVGAFTLTGIATRILTFEQENFPGAGTIDYLGKYWGPGAALEDVSFPEWRANIALTWEYERWTAAIGWNYVDGYTEDAALYNFESEDSEPRDVRSYMTFDVRLGYKIPWIEGRLMAGVNNVFDEQPPLVESSFENAYDRRLADIRGRMYFIEFTKEF